MQARHLARLEALYAGKRLEQPMRLCGIGGHSSRSALWEPEAWVEDALQSLTGFIEQSRDAAVFRPLSIEYPIYGVHFVDAVLGAAVQPTEQEGAGDWWNVPLSTPVGELPPPDLETNLPWSRAQALARAMVASGVQVPFFAPQVLSSPLNIAVNLYGEEFLIALALDPEAAHRDLRVITDTILALTRWFLATLPPAQFQPVVINGRCQPPGFGQICGCSTQLLSAEVYAEFIAPLDAEILASYPRRGGMIHLCGAHTQHIPCWRALPELRAFQINDRAADDFEHYFRSLREDQIIYFTSTERTTVEQVLAISGGRRLVLANC